LINIFDDIIMIKILEYGPQQVMLVAHSAKIYSELSVKQIEVMCCDWSLNNFCIVAGWIISRYDTNCGGNGRKKMVY